jgi:hypothetical protein
VRVRHARVQAHGFMIGLDGQVQLLLAAVGKAEVVISFRPMRIELDAAPQDLDGFIHLVEPVVDGAEIDVGPGPQWIEPRHFLEMVSRTGQIVQQEANGRQSVVDVRRIRAQAQCLQVQLPCLFVLALCHGLAGLHAQSLGIFADHGTRPLLSIGAKSIRGTPSHQVL